MLKKVNDIKKKKPTELHDNTPTVIKLLMIFFDKLCNRCCTKPKVKKSYCYNKMLPLVLSLKSDIANVYAIKPKNAEELTKRIENLNTIIESFKQIFTDLHNVYEQHIFRDEDYNSLIDILSEAQTQIMKWRNSEKKNLKKTS